MGGITKSRWQTLNNCGILVLFHKLKLLLECCTGGKAHLPMNIAPWILWDSDDCSRLDTRLGFRISEKVSIPHSSNQSFPLCAIYIPGDVLKIGTQYWRSRKSLRERNIIIYFTHTHRKREKKKRKKLPQGQPGKLCLVNLENTLKTLISSLVPMTGYMHS